jgi:hypothetical protein
LGTSEANLGKHLHPLDIFGGSTLGLAAALDTTMLPAGGDTRCGNGKEGSLPDKFGKLSPLDKKAITAWLDHHWSMGRACPISGGNAWAIADDLVGIPLVDAAGQTTGLGAYPQVMMVCSECGYTRDFNAFVMGIVKNK